MPNRFLMNGDLRETPWTARIVKDLRKCHCRVRTNQAGNTVEPGWPDRYVSHPLWSGHIEFKSRDGRTSCAQRECMLALNAHSPGSAFVVRNHGTDAGATIETASGEVLGEWDGENVYTLLRLIARLRIELLQASVESLAPSDRYTEEAFALLRTVACLLRERASQGLDPKEYLVSFLLPGTVES